MVDYFNVKLTENTTLEITIYDESGAGCTTFSTDFERGTIFEVIDNGAWYQSFSGNGDIHIPYGKAERIINE